MLHTYIYTIFFKHASPSNKMLISRREGGGGGGGGGGEACNKVHREYIYNDILDLRDKDF